MTPSPIPWPADEPVQCLDCPHPSDGHDERGRCLVRVPELAEFTSLVFPVRLPAPDPVCPCGWTR